MVSVVAPVFTFDLTTAASEPQLVCHRGVFYGRAFIMGHSPGHLTGPTE